ncbi:MAG: hypothetical protein GXY33_12135 [Phycisphaerae bacterium]|nr:hypothetical protein [Phycisphaerae bacterium]
MIRMKTNVLEGYQSGFQEDRCPECGSPMGVTFRIQQQEGTFLWFECTGAGRCVRLLRRYEPQGALQA